jgi:hypothetical protein
MVQQLYTDFNQVGQKRTGSNRGGLPQKYVLTDWGRQLILSQYDGTSEHIDELARRLQVPRWTVKKWGQQLGMARQKEPFWTPEDEAFLERNLHNKSIAEIAKTLGRTKTAVKLKAKRIGVNKTMQEGYTMRGLCMALGCDHHKVERWLEYGWLKGKRRKTERSKAQGGDVWYFTDRDIRKLIVMHPTEIDHRRIDWLWMVDLLAGGDFNGIGSLAPEYASSKEAALEQEQQKQVAS